MTTALVYDPIFLEHHVPTGHPERPQRVEMVMAYLQELHWLERPGLVQLAPRDATLEELVAVHHREYVEEVEAASRAAEQKNGIVELGADTYVSAQTYAAALKAAGAPITAIEALLKGEIDNAYCLVRPPGHHAVAEAAMGFCVFNNVAVAARYALDRHGLERVMIIDYDVHHGNGTQEMFYQDPRVLYVSVHQSAPFFPGTGLWDERGEGDAQGTTINIPLPAKAGFETYEPIFRQIITPAADRFQPQLLLVSAGFDAHWQETISDTGVQNPGILLSTAGFAKLNEIILRIANTQCNGRLVMIHEGGYHLEASACCAATTINQLLGDDAAVDGFGPPPRLDFVPNTDVLISELRRIHGLTGYRMRNRRPPDREKLLREINGPASPQETADSCQSQEENDK